MRIWVSVLFLLLSGCGVLTPLDTKGATDPILVSASKLQRADKLAIFIPGALSSIGVFDGSRNWEDAGYARAFYRYPGLDGLPVDHHVDVEAAGVHIARFANRYPDKDIVLVGYSTGGLVALEAASRISRGRDIRIVAMSPAVEFGGGVPTVLRGARDVVRAVVNADSLTRADIWKSFWAGLLFGPDALKDPTRQDEVSRKIAEGEEIQIKLDLEIVFAHMLGLAVWDLPDDLQVDDVPIGFFIGLNDPVFSTDQTLRFADRLGGVTVHGYDGQGHLLFFTRPRIFADMLAFADGRDPTR